MVMIVELMTMMMMVMMMLIIMMAGENLLLKVVQFTVTVLVVKRSWQVLRPRMLLTRRWNYYFAYCETGFRLKHIDVWQRLGTSLAGLQRDFAVDHSLNPCQTPSFQPKFPQALNPKPKQIIPWTMALRLCES